MKDIYLIWKKHYIMTIIGHQIACSVAIVCTQQMALSDIIPVTMANQEPHNFQKELREHLFRNQDLTVKEVIEDQKVL